VSRSALSYPNTQAKQKDYQLLTVRSFYLANTEAKTVAATLKALLKTRDVVVDDKLNLLIVRDSPEAIRLAEKLVALHDVPEPEVMLEVEILEVKRTRLLDLGIRWPDQLTLTPIASGTGDVLSLADLRSLNSASTAAAVGSINITAKKTDTDANILANPRIRARNREKAKILIGERVPNITSTSTSTGFVAESINYVDVGLKLDVEPTIYLDGEVAIKVALEVSNIISQVQTKSGSIAYQIGTRTAQTVLRLKDGENQVLAGLINDEDRRSANKVPGLGEVPVVGRLFGNQSDDASKTEIVLSITPRIIRNVRRPDAALTEFESGTENSFGARPAAVSPVPANPAGRTPAPTAAFTPAVTPQPTGPATNTPTATTSNVAPAAITSNITPALSGGAILRWQGPADVKVGDIFAVQLLMQSDQPILSVPLAVGFDPRMLQATSVSEGEFLRQGGAQTSFASRVDPSGQVLATGTRSGDTGASALGVLATINFRAIAAISPEARVQLLTVAPVGLGGRSIAPSAAPAHVVRVTN
jgi:general secretion pathway protein D